MQRQEVEAPASRDPRGARRHCARQSVFSATFAAIRLRRLFRLTPLEFVQCPARLPLRKLQGEVSKYFAGIREFLAAKRQSRDGCAGLTVMKSFMTFYQNRPDVRLICVENSTEKICEKKNGALAFTESTVNSTQPIAHCCKMRGQRRFSVDSFWSIFIDKMGV